MKYFKFCKTITLTITLALAFVLCMGVRAMAQSDLIITGVIDGPITGGLPKTVELYILNDIADLSIYSLESANNGASSAGPEFTFPADSATAGDFIYVATETTEFTNFFGFPP